MPNLEELPSQTIFRVVNPALKLVVDSEGKIKLPTYSLPKHTDRHDLSTNDPQKMAQGIISDAKTDHLQLKNIFENDGAKGAITVAASPHTTEKIKDKNNEYPAHLVAWWFGKNNERKNMVDLAEEPPENLSYYIEIIKKGILNSVAFLKEHLPENIKIYIYGLVGHTDIDRRKETGLGKGAQTNPHGHINIVAHNLQDDMVFPQEESDLDRLLKQIGPMDKIIMDRWHNIFIRIAKSVLESEGVICNISYQDNNDVEANTHKISYSSNLEISFPEGQKQGLETVFNLLIPIIRKFNNLYKAVFQAYEGYYKNLGNSENQNTVIENFINNTSQLGLEKTEAEEMLNFALSFHPTFGQINMWLKDDNLDENSKQKLREMKSKYEKLRKKLKNKSLVNTNPNHITRFLITQMLGLPEEKMPEFVWPETLSMTYQFEDFELVENNVNIGKIILSPRFFSNKGILEHITGATIDRVTPQ